MTFESNIYALKPGQKIQRYVIDKELGSGGFGIVYSAYHQWLGYEVVIKEFFPAGLVIRKDEQLLPISVDDRDIYLESLEKFQQECEVLLGLDHPNVVYVYDCFTHNQTAYMVMHKEVGCTLTEKHVEQINIHSRVFNWNELIPMLPPLLDGLDYIHSKGITHRDIKPDNVYLQQTKLFQPKIIDFGAVKVKAKKFKSRYSPLTEGYAPFEQENGLNAIGPWTDVYSIAMTLLRVLSNQFPPSATLRPEPNSNEKDPVIDTLSMLSSSIPHNVLDALYQATMKHHEERTQSIRQLRNNLGI